MPALDICHAQIVRALESDGWTVDAKPALYTSSKRLVFIDIRANRTPNGRAQQTVLVEVKCFADKNLITQDLYTAFGQYIFYRAVLDENGDNTALYLAATQNVYDTVFVDAAIRAVRDHRIKLLLVDLIAERITGWIET